MFLSRSNSSLKFIEWGVHTVLFAMLILGGYCVRSYWANTLRADQIEIGKEVYELQQLLDRADNVAEEHDRLVLLKKTIEQRAESIRDRIPDHPNEGEFLKQTTSAAKACGITITEYLRRGIDTHEDHSRLIIHISLEGTFENICRFMHELEQLPRISQVNRMQLDNTHSDGEYPMELTLVLFFRSEQSQARIARATQ